MDIDIEAAEGGGSTLIDINSLNNKTKNIKPLTILGIGDPHIKNSNFDIIEKLLVDIVNYVELWQPDLVVCFGDLMHDF